MIDMPVNKIRKSSTTQIPIISNRKNKNRPITEKDFYVESDDTKDNEFSDEEKELGEVNFTIFHSIWSWIKKNYIVSLQLSFSFLCVVVIYFLLNGLNLTNKVTKEHYESNPIYKSFGSWSFGDIEFVLLDKLAAKFTNKEYYKKTCTFLNEHVYGDVLEIGAGRGFVLPCLDSSKIKSYSAVDTNSYSFNDLQKRFEKHLQSNGVSKGEFLAKSASDISEIYNDSIDTVFMVRTLCSVNDAEVLAVFSEIHRILKPGGKLLFVEHVRDWKDTFRRKIQKTISPIWKVFFRGCQFKDGSMYAAILSKLGFKVTTSNEYISMFPNRMFSMLEPQCLGVAIKL